MRTLDDFLIDRGFQPVSDLLARWISCYGIAAFLLTGACFLVFASAALRQSWGALFPGLLGIAWAWRLYEVHQMDRGGYSTALPAERIKDAFWRPFYVVFCVFDVFLEISRSLDLAYWIGNQGWLLNTLALYFMACRKLPPKPRKARAPEPSEAAPAHV